MSAICSHCGMDMMEADGCWQTPIDQRDNHNAPIPYGKETHRALKMQVGEDKAQALLDVLPTPDRCPDCNVRLGENHHISCDQEECPICHLQVLMCGQCLSAPEEEDIERYTQVAHSVLNGFKEVPGLIEAGKVEADKVRNMLEGLTNKEIAELIRKAFRESIPAVFLMTSDQKRYLGTFFAYSLYLAERVMEDKETIQ